MPDAAVCVPLQSDWTAWNWKDRLPPGLPGPQCSSKPPSAHLELNALLHCDEIMIVSSVDYSKQSVFLSPE